jgi:DNA polymerase III epsilon subunit-like protein
MKLINKKIVIFDLETNGCKFLPIQHEYHEIIQISAISIEGKTIVNNYIKNNIHIPLPSTKCHNLTDELVELKGLDQRNIIESFIKDIEIYKGGDETLYLVAHNCFGFDMIVFNNMLLKLKIELPSWITYIDTLPIYKELYPNLVKNSSVGLSCYTLNNLHNHFFGEDIENAHDAHADVVALRKLVLRIQNYDINVSPQDIDSNINLKNIRFIGNWRFNKLKLHINCTTLQQIRDHFNDKSSNVIEEFIRSILRISMNSQVIYLLDLFAMKSHELEQLKGDKRKGFFLSKLKLKQFKSENDFLIYFIYDCQCKIDLLENKLNINLDEQIVDKLVYTVFKT